ncbi:TVP38/TMEM64 family protein [Alkalilimnicola ehrlichii]|nr:TVP38/TMEM64 family protein [Alkalilimnicola ehrlichii]
MSWINYFRLIFLVLLLSALAVGVLLLREYDITDVRDLFAAMGAWAPSVFLLVYIVATIIWLPGPVLTMTGGMLFGPWWGTLYSLIGATVGGVLAFMIARYLARDWFERSIGPRLRPVKRGVDDEGWRFVLVARVTPVVPYAALNYGLGLTRIKLLPYTVASAVGMVPATWAYSYLGDVSARILGEEPAGPQPILLALAVLMMLLFLPRFVGRIRHHMREEAERSNDDLS